MFRFETAGESHGECLVATLTGLPSGVPVSLERINRELWRRQQGFGRGGRMKIETDMVEIVAGVRHSQIIGAPIAMIIRNNVGALQNRSTCAWLELPIPRAAPWSASHRWARRYHPRTSRAGGSILESAEAQ